MVSIRTEIPLKPLLAHKITLCECLKIRVHKLEPLNTFEDMGEYYHKAGAPLTASHPSTYTSPQGRELCQGKGVEVIGWCCCVLSPLPGPCCLTLFLRAATGPSQCSALFPTSARGSTVAMVCLKAQGPSDLPALCGTYNVRCSFASFIRVSRVHQGGSKMPLSESRGLSSTPPHKCWFF